MAEPIRADGLRGREFQPEPIRSSPHFATPVKSKGYVPQGRQLISEVLLRPSGSSATPNRPDLREPTSHASEGYIPILCAAQLRQQLWHEPAGGAAVFRTSPGSNIRPLNTSAQP